MFLLLQIADAAFPTGAFTHSNGLEAAVQLGEVRDEASVRAFCHAALWQAGLGALPFVGAAWSDPSELSALDRMCDTILTNHVQNRASRAQGRTTLSVACEVFPSDELERVRDGALYAHLAPAFGVVTRIVGLSRHEALIAFAHGTARSVLSAAVRLGVVGPHAAQRIQHELAATLNEIVTLGERATPDDAAQPSPLLDVWQGQHDRLYARLFQS